MRRALTCILLFFVLFAIAAQPVAEPTYENLNAILWVQTAVEYRAATVQTYRLAEASLLRAKRDKHWSAALEQTGHYSDFPRAVIMDLDETVLDNSAFEARLTVEGAPYSAEGWDKWVNERRAGLVPGAKEFIEFAQEQGVVSLYITNRQCDPSKDDDPTVELLRNLHLPVDPPAERLYCASKGIHDKGPRRKLCADKYRILLQFGDQLGDFLSIPGDPGSLEERESLFETHKNWWGEKWFQLPNPMYGSWEGALGYSGKKNKLRWLRQ